MTNTRTNRAKAVILTALPVEYNATCTHLTDLREVIHPSGNIYERGIFHTNNLTWDVEIAQIGVGNPGAAFEVERAIAHFQPHVILFMGVAGGLKDVKLGDVVAATKVYGYESGKADATFLPRPEVGNVTYALEQRARREARRSDWLQRLKHFYGHLPEPVPLAHVGPIAAGEKVISSTQSRERKLLQKNYGDALAVAMEEYGFLKAVHANQQVSALVIRGISDLLDKKSEADAANSQEIAAWHASAFAFEVLAKLTGNELSYAPRTQTTAQKMPGPAYSSRPEGANSIYNIGSMQGTMQGGSHNQQTNFYAPVYHTPPKDPIAEGKSKMEQGKHALLDKDYTSAKQYLEDAHQSLAEQQAPRENAYTRYLLALAYLGEDKPANTTLPIMERVEGLLQSAIRLHPSSVYYYTLAIFKKDFARNGWSQTYYLRTAQEHLNQAHVTPFYPFDQECLNILKRCQPHLMAEEEEW